VSRDVGMMQPEAIHLALASLSIALALLIDSSRRRVVILACCSARSPSFGLSWHHPPLIGLGHQAPLAPSPSRLIATTGSTSNGVPQDLVPSPLR
jgi:hypothetical protein